MMKHVLVLFAILTAAALPNAFANDSIGRVAAGGVTFLKSSEIKMVEEVLEISRKKILVHYRFLNESADDIHTTVVFPMPSYRWSPEVLNVGPMKNFSVMVNGAPISPKRIRKAVMKKRDITEKLRAIGLTDAQMFDDFGGECNSSFSEIEVGCGLSEKQRNKVAQLLGIKDYYPTWEVEETYHWEQTFPAGKEIEVEHEYSPFVGGRYSYPMWNGNRQSSVELPVAQSKKEACVDVSTAQGVERKVLALINKGAKSVSINQSDVEYILGTGRNWKGPIGHFTLRIQKDNPDEIISVCMAGKARKVDAKTIEFSQVEYVPQDRLIVYFYSVEPK